MLIVEFYLIFQEKLFPGISIYWHMYQKQLLESLHASKQKLVLCGDGRHDSMGHSAKYGAYTIMGYNPPQIIHFELVQVCIHSIDDSLYSLFWLLYIAQSHFLN